MNSTAHSVAHINRQPLAITYSTAAPIQEYQFQGGAELSHYQSRGGQVVIVERIPKFLLTRNNGGGRESLRKLIEE